MPESKTWIFKAQRNILPGNVNNFDIHVCRTLSLFRPEFWLNDKEVPDSDGMIAWHAGSLASVLRSTQQEWDFLVDDFLC